MSCKIKNKTQINIYQEFSDLLDMCIKCINSYNAITMTPDSHSDLFIQNNNIVDKNSQVFIQQVFYGCWR